MLFFSKVLLPPAKHLKFLVFLMTWIIEYLDIQLMTLQWHIMSWNNDGISIFLLKFSCFYTTVMKSTFNGRHEYISSTFDNLIYLMVCILHIYEHISACKFVNIGLSVIWLLVTGISEYLWRYLASSHLGITVFVAFRREHFFPCVCSSWYLWGW